MVPGRLAQPVALASLLAALVAPALARAEVPAAPAPRPALVAPRPAPASHPAPTLDHAAKVTRAPEAPGRSPARPAASAVRPATPSLDVSVPAATARHELAAVHADVVRRVQSGEHPVVVFDIDDTLLTWPRADLPNRQPVPGALAYLSSLRSAGATIVYITGRHEPDRGETVAQLKQFGFPVGADAQLVLNDSKLPTVEYKAVATRNVVRTLGTPVAVFDNEKENARMFRRELPSPATAVFRLRTTSIRGDSGGEGPITVIDDFTPALPKEIHLSATAAAPTG